MLRPGIYPTTQSSPVPVGFDPFVSTEDAAPSLFISAPAYVMAGQAFHAEILFPESGATFTWSVTGATGASTGATITLTPGAPGDVVIEATQHGAAHDGVKGTARVRVLEDVPLWITTDAEEAPAGEDGHSATVIAVPGVTYEWSIVNGYLPQGTKGSSVIFAFGKGNDAETVLKVRAIAGDATKEVQKIVYPLPRTKTVSIQTPAFGPASGIKGSFDAGTRLVFTAVEADLQVRLRIYDSATARDDDYDRAFGVLPEGHHGMMLEVLTDIDHLSLIMDPEGKATKLRAGAEPGARWYYSITKLDGAMLPVNLTLTFTKEA